MIKNYLSWSLLPMFLTLLAVTNLCFCEEPGSGGCSDDGDAVTLDGNCAPVCNSGYNWCGESRQCLKSKSEAGFNCTCSSGYYEDNTGSCQIGRYFGGKLFYKKSVTGTTAQPQTSEETTVQPQTSEETTVQPQTSGGTTDEPETASGVFLGIPGRASAVELRSTSECDVTKGEAESLVVDIYETDTYYHSSSILSWDSDECSAVYELVFKDAVAVNAEYIQDIFISKTGNCVDPSTYPALNCTASRDNGIDPGLACAPNGTFNGKCDPDTASCNVSDSGSFFCDCKLDQSVLPYTGAYSCTEIKCSKDKDCSGGGIHGICNTDADNEGDYYCQCNWGFTGDTCGDPWWFVFTVLTGAFGVLVIVVLVSCICMSTRTKTVKDDGQKDDLDLKNPFVDFQPGVRARVSTNIYSSVTDSISTPTTYGHSNPAFNNNAYDENDKGTAYAAAAQGNDYF